MDKKVNEKVSKELWIKLIIAFLGVIGVSATVTLYLGKNIVNQNYKQIADEIKNQTVQIEEMNSTINKITNKYYNEYYNENYLSLIDENTSVDTLLEYAENSYLANNYEVVATIYSMEKLEDNVIANTNLGYMYANGEYFDQNDEMADKYYDKAISMNSMEALNNKIALHMRKKKDDCIELLRQGYNADDDNAIEFISSQFENVLLDSEQEKRDTVYHFLYEIPKAEQQKIIEQFYFWDEEGIGSYSYSPDNDEFTQYIKIDEKYISNQTIKIYKKYVLRCKGIGFLEEQFMMR